MLSQRHNPNMSPSDRSRTIGDQYDFVHEALSTRTIYNDKIFSNLASTNDAYFITRIEISIAV